jgi:hypothetical protein
MYYRNSRETIDKIIAEEEAARNKADEESLQLAMEL